MIVRLPSTITTAFGEGGAYEFRVKRSDLKFFDKTTGLRTEPRTL
jgi:hypothetical protein